VRIAIDGRELEGRPTGVGRYLGGLLRAWVALPGDERFLVLHREGLAWPLPDHPRIESCRLPAGGPTRSLYWEQVVLARALRRLRPDAVFGPAEGLPLAWRGPAAMTLHDLSYFAHPEWFGRLHGARRRRVVRWSARRAHRIIAVSEFTRGEAARYLRVPAERLTVVRHGIDDALARTAATPEPELRRRLGISGPFALTVGSVFERRCPTEVIGAFEQLTDVGLGLVIAGDDRRRTAGDLEAEISRRGLRGRVVWARYCSEADLAGLYRAADHLIYLSCYEGFGLPPLEAMSFGLPVIVSAIGALKEIYGESALAIARHDESGIAAAVRRIVTDDRLRDELRRRGRALVERSSLAGCASRTLELLRELRR